MYTHLQLSVCTTVATYEQMLCRHFVSHAFFTANTQTKGVCVCVCVSKRCQTSLSPPASPPCVLLGLSDASQCFHGVLETEGDPLI